MSSSVVKIAFIDDEESLCEIASFLFKNKGVEIATYDSPFLAIQECNKNLPDLIFTDYFMPGINGTMLAKKMPPGIPIYLLTGAGSNIESDFPFTEILGKPYNVEKIKKIIHQHFENLNSTPRKAWA